MDFGIDFVKCQGLIHKFRFTLVLESYKLVRIFLLEKHVEVGWPLKGLHGRSDVYG